DRAANLGLRADDQRARAFDLTARLALDPQVAVADVLAVETGVRIDDALVARILATELHRIGRHLCLIGKAIRIQVADDVLAGAGVGLAVSLGSEDHSWLLPLRRGAQRAGTGRDE